MLARWVISISGLRDAINMIWDCVRLAARISSNNAKVCYNFDFVNAVDYSPLDPVPFPNVAALIVLLRLLILAALHMHDRSATWTLTTIFSDNYKIT